MGLIPQFLARLSPRAGARRRYHAVALPLNADLHRLLTVTDPADRAATLERVADSYTQLASLTIPAFGHLARPLSLSHIDDAVFARIIATTEHARATGQPRQRRDRPDLEQRLGALLDQLADAWVDDKMRAAIFAVLQPRTQPFRHGNVAPSILELLRQFHAARAAGRDAP